MKMTARQTVCFLMLSMLVGTAFAASAKMPTQVQMRLRDGTKVGAYMVAGAMYRFLQPDEAAKATVGEAVSFIVKLDNVAGVRLVVQGFDAVQFRLAKSVKLPADRAGSNLLIGGARLAGDDALVFEVRGAELLPNDLVLFQARKAALEKQAKRSVGDYLALGDWMTDAMSVSQIVDEAMDKQYTAARDGAYRQGLKMLADQLAPTPKAMAGVLTWWAGYEAEQRGGEAASELAKISKTVFGASAEGMRAVRAGKALSPRQARRLCAVAVLELGKVRARLLDDRAAVSVAQLAAAKIDPKAPAVRDAMQALGFVLYKSAWMSREQASSARRRAVAKAEAAQPVAAAPEATVGTSAKLLAGTGFVTGRENMALFLSAAGGAALPEIAEKLGSWPEDVARRALFLASAWYAKDASAQRLLIAALAAEAPGVRRDAAALLAGRGAPAAVTARLVVEPHAPTAQHMLESLWAMRGGAGVGAVVTVVGTEGMPEALRKAAAALLEAESGQRRGADAFGWKVWWEGAKKDFKRKPLPGALD